MTLASASKLYKEPAHAALRVRPLQQLFREHLLCFTTLEQGLYAEAHFVLLSPRHNHRVERMQRLYSAFLTDPTQGTVPFHFVELEELIAAYALAGDERHAALLFERYCDWAQLDTLVEQSIADRECDWNVVPLRRSAAIALVARAG